MLVLIAWATGTRGTPRNVLVQRADGALAVRPFRGLRRRSPSRPDGAS